MAKKKEKSNQQHAATSNTKVALIGAGKMGGILLQAFLNKGLFRPENIRATVQHPERAAALAKQWGVSVSTDNLAAARNSDLILLGVKPQTVPEVLAQIRPALTAKKTIISFAASVKTGAIEKAAGVDLAVIRAMPNTPSLLGCGATALCRGKFVTDEQLAVAEKVFASVGRTVTVDEKHMDAVTALSASGPPTSTSFWNRLRRAASKSACRATSPLCWPRKWRWAQQPWC